MPRWFSPCFQDAIFHTLNYLGSGMGLVWWCEVCGMSMSGAICSRIQSMNACRMSNGQWNDAWQEGSCCDVQTLFQAGLLLLFFFNNHQEVIGSVPSPCRKKTGQSTSQQWIHWFEEVS